MNKNTKKTIKAKKNKVKSRKTLGNFSDNKKRSKKKISDDRKSIKKKKLSVKQTKRKQRKKVTMDELYSIINKAQLGKKKIIFACNIIDVQPIEHIIKDSEIKYDKKELKTQAVFILFPSENMKYEEAVLDQIEIMDDEIPDADQIFP